MSDKLQAFYRKRAKLNRLEKRELPEWSRTYSEIKKLADKGSACDQANLKFAEAGLKKTQDEITRAKAWIAQHEGSFGNLWIQKAEKLDND